MDQDLVQGDRFPEVWRLVMGYISSGELFYMALVCRVFCMAAKNTLWDRKQTYVFTTWIGEAVVSIPRLVFSVPLAPKSMIARAAIVANRLDVLKHAVEEFRCKIIQPALVAAVSYGNLEICDWIDTRGVVLANPENDLVQAAAENGHLHVLQWLKETLTVWRVDRNVIYQAALRGHLAILQWLYESGREYFELWSEAMDGAAEGGHLECLKWLRSIGSYWNGATSDCAARSGDVNVLRYVIVNGCQYNRLILWECALKKGDLASLKYLLEDTDVVTDEDLNFFDSDTLNTLAASGTTLETFLWAIKNGCELDSQTWAAACGGGNLEVVEHISVHYPERANLKKLCITACHYGYLHLLQWAKSQQYQMTSSEIMQTACLQNRVDICMWLKKNFTFDLRTIRVQNINFREMRQWLETSISLKESLTEEDCAMLKEDWWSNPY